ncbi:MAG: 3-ketoacyl-ACP reductase [Planctomycetota bacterium]
MGEARRVAIVTGGGRGIGRGIARALAGAGFDLVVNGVRERTDDDPALAELRARGAAVAYARGDVGDARAREEIVAAARARFGRLHVLVNNAGVGSRERGTDLLATTEDAFAWILRANLLGPHFLTQLAARWMLEQKRADPGWTGCVVNVTSVSAELASIDRADYCVSKAALSMATRAWAMRLAPEGIPVYELRPGIVRTDMTARAAADYDRRIAAGLVPEPRWGTPEDMGRAVAMLATGGLTYAPGQVLVVDGGMSLPRL